MEKLFNDFINIPKPKYKKMKNSRIENYLDDNLFDFFLKILKIYKINSF